MNPTRRNETRARREDGRVPRKLLIILGVAVALLVAAALIVPRFLDPESYRERIEQALQDATGWEAELGEMDASLLRGATLTVRPARLEAPGGESHLEIGVIAVRARLLPLLGGRLEIRRIDLVEPEIVVQRPGPGERWVLPAVFDDAGHEGEAAPSADPEPSGQAASPGAEAGASPTEDGSRLEVSIGKLRVRDGRLRVEDRSLDPSWVVDLRGLDLDLSPGDGEVSGGGKLHQGGALGWSGNLGQTVILELDSVPTDLLVPLLGEGLLHPGGTLSGEIESRIPERIEGRLSGRDLLLLDGERPFEEIAARFELSGRERQWSLERFELDAGDASIRGSGSLIPAMAVALELPATPLEVALSASESVLPLPLDLGGPGSVEARLWIDQPRGGALTYRAEGQLSAARFSPGEMLPDARDVRAEFSLSPAGILEIRVLEGTVGGGPLNGTARVEPLLPPGRLTFDGGLEQAALGQLLGGLVSDAAERIQGATGLEARMSLDLGREELDARALGGRLELDSREVSLPGWDLEAAIRRTIEEKKASLSGAAAELLEKHLGEAGKDEAAASAEEGEASGQLLDRLVARIDFDSFPWNLESIELGAGEVDARGSGRFDPVAGEVDLRLTARLDAEETARLVERNRELRALVGSDGRLAVPVHLEGALLRPSIGVDLGSALSESLDADDKKEAVKGLLKGLLDRKRKKED